MLETQRLVIRELEQKEIPRLYELNYSPFVKAFNLFEPITLKEFQERHKEVNPENFYLILKNNNQLIGEIGVHPDYIRYQVKSIALSYWLGEEFTRQGYMTEALERMIQDLFEKKGYEIIAARVFSENIASLSLLARLGFQQEAYLKRAVKNTEGQVFDDIFFVLFKEDWQKSFSESITSISSLKGKSERG